MRSELAAEREAKEDALGDLEDLRRELRGYQDQSSTRGGREEIESLRRKVEDLDAVCSFPSLFIKSELANSNWGY